MKSAQLPRPGHFEAPSPAESRMVRLVWAAAAVFALAVFWNSASRWAHFEYRTFDLAFYVQALWKLAHGDFSAGSLLNVPLMGEHANGIVLPLIPLFALLPHPLLPVAAQILAIASMAPVAYRIARRTGFEPEPAGLLALAVLLMPATGFVALHEFHPEAFTAPFLLLAIDAFQRQSIRRFWFWSLATLACKENMTLLLAFWAGANAFTGWREGRDRAWLLKWCLWPGLAALGWAALWAGVLSPRWNGGNIDFAGLYGQLMVPWGELPGAVARHLARSLQGNLLPALIVPLCGLPLLRGRWWFAALPILGQHYLAIRSSEWQIEFHYAAPLVPLFWIAACEAAARFPSRKARRALAMAVIAGCAGGQAWFGPLRTALEPPAQAPGAASLAARRAALASIPRGASVVAGLPYLSHLAEREELYSLHHLLKGLKTLSRQPWQPPAPTDFVLVDYADRATFNASAGYYHPKMRLMGGRVVPSSDRLLHEFLRRASWEVESRDSLTIFRRRKAGSPPSVAPVPPEMPPANGKAIPLGPATTLLAIGAAPQPGGLLRVESLWRFSGERKIIPWMALYLQPRGNGPGRWLVRGLCAPEGWDNGRPWRDSWTATLSGSVPPGVYQAQAIFSDNPALCWARQADPKAPLKRLGTADLGLIEVR